MYYGREGQMKRLHADMNNPLLPARQRQAADKALQTMSAQFKDKHLMRLRERLIRASQAGDPVEMARITLQMKDYQGEERESGHYGI